LDLPTTAHVDGGVEKIQHLVGDSLEIQMFEQSGWRSVVVVVLVVIVPVVVVEVVEVVVVVVVVIVVVVEEWFPPLPPGRKHYAYTDN